SAWQPTLPTTCSRRNASISRSSSSSIISTAYAPRTAAQPAIRYRILTSGAAWSRPRKGIGRRRASPDRSRRRGEATPPLRTGPPAPVIPARRFLPSPYGPRTAEHRRRGPSAPLSPGATPASGPVSPSGRHVSLRRSSLQLDEQRGLGDRARHGAEEKAEQLHCSEHERRRPEQPVELRFDVEPVRVDPGLDRSRHRLLLHAGEQAPELLDGGALDVHAAVGQA